MDVAGSTKISQTWWYLLPHLCAGKSEIFDRKLAASMSSPRPVSARRATDINRSASAVSPGNVVTVHPVIFLSLLPKLFIGSVDSVIVVSKFTYVEFQQMFYPWK